MKKCRGFTLVELLVVVAVIFILASLFIPSAGSLIDRSKAAKICANQKNLQSGCIAHYTDTGRYAYEVDVTESGVGVNEHQLSMRQTYGGWAGPYMDRPLNWNDNPFNQDIDIGQDLSTWAGNFDLDRNGSLEAVGPGNLIIMQGIPDTAALRVDAALDGTGPGSWRDRGQVKMIWGNWMALYLVGGNR
ncbi:MAG: prepilin-type N-terminal cleavage/methylation domain-containing protein [Armatimonadetes bacterium]|nr:prepilin-type N-terminal cleavage/methylation domain-containing protein [Armatimonadota bacterium]